MSKLIAQFTKHSLVILQYYRSVQNVLAVLVARTYARKWSMNFFAGFEGAESHLNL
ncbi:MAG: hypothetical protein ACI9CE_001295 [Flavobacterium sp.]|jgi:hypothetical protein